MQLAELMLGPVVVHLICIRVAAIAMTASKLWPVLPYRMALLHRSGCNRGIPKFRGPCFTLWMAHRTNSPAESASPKQRYRVTNWPGDNRALVSRGAVALWINAVLSGWRASGGKRYSDVAILCAGTLRGVHDAPVPDPGFPEQPQEHAWPDESGPALFDPCAERRRHRRAADFARLGHPRFRGAGRCIWPSIPPRSDLAVSRFLARVSGT